MKEMLFGGAAGVIVGFIFNRIAVVQVRRRTDDEDRRKFVGGVPAAVLSSLITGLLFALIFRLYGDIFHRIEYSAYISIAVAIGVVDLGIKKIPNLSVSALLAVKTAAVIYELIQGVSVKEAIVPSLIGLAAAFILYQLPMLIGIPIGVGDVKFASAIGFCLGLSGFLQAALIMAAGLAVLLLVLVATKKGSLKTKVPMGPFLAFGTAATVIFPVLGEVTRNILPV